LTEIKYKSEVIGKGGISARVVAHSKSAYSDTEIVTWEYEAPKCILAELNTHRMFSRNAQSSRAVPVKKVIEQIRNNPVTPIHWGSNQAGMVAGEEINEVVQFNNDGHIYELDRDEAWKHSAEIVADLQAAWEDAGYHKQIVNRIGEAFTFVRGVITATEFDNFFHLRIHPAADPFIQELARCMYEAYKRSEPEVLYEGEWHLPYVDLSVSYDKEGIDKIGRGISELIMEEKSFPLNCQSLLLKAKGLTIERAKQISAAACAQVSFRKLDLSDETVDRVYSRLVDDENPHASCVEHQCTPMKQYEWPQYCDPSVWFDVDGEGITHADRNGQYWSGNFKHWIQNRKLIPNEVCLKYVEKFND
jgi:thymidylate synthase ThyX